jgi:hypothetical protein
MFRARHTYVSTSDGAGGSAGGTECQSYLLQLAHCNLSPATLLGHLSPRTSSAAGHAAVSVIPIITILIQFQIVVIIRKTSNGLICRWISARVVFEDITAIVFADAARIISQSPHTGGNTATNSRHMTRIGCLRTACSNRRRGCDG